MGALLRMTPVRAGPCKRPATSLTPCRTATPRPPSDAILRIPAGSLMVPAPETTTFAPASTAAAAVIAAASADACSNGMRTENPSTTAPLYHTRRAGPAGSSARIDRFAASRHSRRSVRSLEVAPPSRSSSESQFGFVRNRPAGDLARRGAPPLGHPRNSRDAVQCSRPPHAAAAEGLRSNDVDRDRRIGPEGPRRSSGRCLRVGRQAATGTARSTPRRRRGSSPAGRSPSARWRSSGFKTMQPSWALPPFRTPRLAKPPCALPMRRGFSRARSPSFPSRTLGS